MSHELDALHQFVCQLRYVSLITQSAHWTTSGPTSIQDHEFLGTLYEMLTHALDAVAERIVGLGGNPPSVTQQLAFGMQGPDKEEYTLFDIAQCVAELVAVCGAIDDLPLSGGVENMIQQIADDLEQQLFFLRQRLSV